ncbi:MAG: hypothetical protein AAB262_05600 [Elusimicrobiota bacterium]
MKRIRVRALGREGLILSKLSRYNDRDRADIEFLAESGKIDLILGEHFGLGPFVF